LTRAGSIVVGSQAAPYTAAAADGRDWRFQVVRIATDRLAACGDRIRRRGFSLLQDDAPISQLAAGYLAALSSRIHEFSPDEIEAAIGALDLLLAAALGDMAALEHDGGQALGAARLVAARGYIERCAG